MCTNSSNIEDIYFTNDEIVVEDTTEPFGVQLQKYGEIVLSKDSDEFILCCMLCTEIFFDYQLFIKHTQLFHKVSIRERDEASVCGWDDELNSPVIETDEILGMEVTSTDNCVTNSANENVVERCNSSNSYENDTTNPSEEVVLLEESNNGAVEYLLEDCLEVDDIKDLDNVEETRQYANDSLIRNKRLLWYFIGLYWEHPCLWRADHEHISDHDERSAAIEQISNSMHKRFGFHITPTKVIKTIRNMRASYLREYRRKAASKHGTYKPKLWYYKKLSFIENAEDYRAETEDCLDKIMGKQKPKCKTCQRQFNTRAALLQHHRTYAPCKPFRCQHCSKSFSSRPNLVSHLNSHVPPSKRRYTCEFCGLKIAMRHNYLVHLRRHTQKFPHHCVICGKGAPNIVELKSHILNHTGERPYVCEICGLTFKQRNVLKRHQLQQHEPLK